MAVHNAVFYQSSREEKFNAAFRRHLRDSGVPVGWHCRVVLCVAQLYALVYAMRVSCCPEGVRLND